MNFRALIAGFFAGFVFLGIPELVCRAADASLEATEFRFSPNADIEPTIVADISAARTQVLVEAYTLTSKPIIAALAAARDRGVEVVILLDGDYGVKTGAKLIAKMKDRVMVDSAENAHGGIAHSKVGIIDRSTIIYGSYNWTGKANTANHEVCATIRKASFKCLQAFLDDFNKHKAHCTPLP